MNERIYTMHALERMSERGVTRPMVEAVLRAGDVLPDSGGAGVRVALCDLIVVVDPLRGTVVTVLPRGNPPGRVSAKRWARRPGQARRRHERDRAKREGRWTRWIVNA